MGVEVRIPALGESITEGVIVRWIKADGDFVAVDEPLLELETEKASVEIPASTSGRLRILQPAGATVRVGQVVATIEPQERAAEASPAPDTSATRKEAEAAHLPDKAVSEREQEKEQGPRPGAGIASARPESPAVPLSPAVRRLVAEHGLDVTKITGSGKGGRLTKADVLAHLEQLQQQQAAPSTAAPSEVESSIQEAGSPVRAPSPTQEPAAQPRSVPQPEERAERRVPMTPLRRRIAERLVQAQRSAAILTTFNEVDMSAVLELRGRYREQFQKRHGVGLGLMSFFAKACVAALQEIPVINAFVDGEDIVYHDSVHLGIAVATPRGLVVPVIHHAERLSFAEIEKEIERLAGLAREGKLSIPDVSGGTFTITNGGVFGSLLSTPLLNPPQSGILGMHKIEKRPVVVNDQVVIRPMMYVALSYDHRLVDGEQAVTFLVRVKERIEDPSRLLLDI